MTDEFDHCITVYNVSISVTVEWLIHIGFLLSFMNHSAIVAEVLKELKKKKMYTYQSVVTILMILNHDRGESMHLSSN